MRTPFPNLIFNFINLKLQGKFQNNRLQMEKATHKNLKSQWFPPSTNSSNNPHIHINCFDTPNEITTKTVDITNIKVEGTKTIRQELFTIRIHHSLISSRIQKRFSLMSLVDI